MNGKRGEMDIIQESTKRKISDKELDSLISWEQSGLFNHLLTDKQIELIKVKLQAFLELKECRKNR